MDKLIRWDDYPKHLIALPSELYEQLKQALNNPKQNAKVDVKEDGNEIDCLLLDDSFSQQAVVFIKADS